MMRVLSAIALAFSLLAGAAEAGDAKLAYFQPKNIFHSGLKNTHTIALTFDDGPNANTEDVLDVLKALGVKGTFFIVGKMAKTHPDVLARIAAEGHLLANHSATHAMLGEHFVEHPELLLDQIREVDDEIAPLMPAGTKFYFRAPYGSWRTAHADVLNADPMLKKYVGPIYWDEGGDIVDERRRLHLERRGLGLLASRLGCRHLRQGLLARNPPQERRRGADALHPFAIGRSRGRGVVAPLVEEGYSFVRLDQIEDYHQYETPPETTGPVVAFNGIPK